jgi:hypothetical protein
LELLAFHKYQGPIYLRYSSSKLFIFLLLNYSITPKLSIQFYGQPFVSSGVYTDFKRVADPRSRDYTRQVSIFKGKALELDTSDNKVQLDENGDGIMDYSVGNPNFNFLQFQENPCFKSIL